MAKQSRTLRESGPSQPIALATPRLEQLLYACGGYVVGQLLGHLFMSQAKDGDLLLLGIIGAAAGVVAHVLVRGVGIKVPGVGKRFKMPFSLKQNRNFDEKDSSRKARRGSRYRQALRAFRRPFKGGAKASEAPGNEEKIVKTSKGYRVGKRDFSRRSEAEDYLYLGEASDQKAQKDEP